MKESTIRESFRVTGLCPLDPHLFSTTDFAPSTTTSTTPHLLQSYPDPVNSSPIKLGSEFAFTDSSDEEFQLGDSDDDAGQGPTPTSQSTPRHSSSPRSLMDDISMEEETEAMEEELGAECPSHRGRHLDDDSASEPEDSDTEQDQETEKEIGRARSRSARKVRHALSS